MANTSPIFALTPNNGKADISAANTARDGSGSLVTLITAGSSGTRVDWIKWTSAQASAAALSASIVLRVWVTDSNDANPELIAEGLMASVTASNTAIGAWGCFDFVNGYFKSATTIIDLGMNGGLIVDASKKIKVTQSVYAGAQDRMSVISKAGDF
jgi:hypothetical protein